jgi:hypothetical protein
MNDGVLMPAPLLLCGGLLWAAGVWLAVFPDQAQKTWARLFGTDRLVPNRLTLRVIGTAWALVLTFMTLFNLAASRS